MRFAACLLGCVLVAASAFAQTLSEQEALQFADGLYSREMWELALKEYRTLLAEHPDSEKADHACFRIGECLRRLGRPQEADDAYRTVFEKYPRSSLRFRAALRRADLAADAKQYDAARAQYEAILKAGPPPEVASACLFLEGEALLKQERRAEAEPLFLKVIAEYPDSEFRPYAMLRLGGIYAAQPEKTGEALKLYEQAAGSQTNRVAAEAWFQIGELQFSLKNFAKSAEAYRKLLTDYADDPRAKEAALQAAWACHHAGLFADALKAAVQALDAGAGSDQAEWLYLKANCERQLMKNEEAVASYAAIIEKFGGTRFAVPARYERALVYYRTGRFREAVADALQIPSSAGLSKDVYWLLAESYAALKDDDNAIQYYRLIAKDFPKSDVAPDAMYRLAHLLRAKGNRREAVRFYQMVAANFPEHELAPKALFASAVCLAEDQRHEEAARDLDTLIKLYPTNALAEDAVYHRAMCEMRLKRDADAMAGLRELVRTHPSSRFLAEAHYWLGALLKETGRDDDAEAELRQALEAGPNPEIQREARFLLAGILQKKGRNEEAADLFQSLLSSPLQGRFSPALLQWLAEFKSQKGMHAESLAAAQRLAEAHKDAVWQQAGQALAGRAYCELGRRDEAKKALRAALEAKANTKFAGEAAFRLGQLCLDDGEYKEALQLYRKAAAAASTEAQMGVRARSYIGMAKASKGLGEMEDAARYFMGVAVLYDDANLVPECLFEAAECYRRAGRELDARKTLDELRRRYPDSVWAKKAEGL